MRLIDADALLARYPDCRGLRQKVEGMETVEIESQKITDEEALEICEMALRCLMARRDEICQQHPEFSIENCLHMMKHEQDIRTLIQIVEDYVNARMEENERRNHYEIHC